MGLEEKLKPFEMGEEIRNYKKQLKQTGKKRILEQKHFH